MKPIDYAKAVGVGVAVLVLNLLITTMVITVYSMLVEPGRPQAFYNALAPKIGAWSGPIGGVALMFVAGWVFGRRRPERNALAFAGVAFLAYLVLDAGMALAFAPAAQVLRAPFLLSLTAAGVAALVGAGLARRQGARG
jgi:hypothetical protein